MVRNIVALVVVLGVGQVAWGQNQPVSYFVAGTGDQTLVIENDFVLTDVFWFSSPGLGFLICAGNPCNEILAKLGGETVPPVRLTSGIPVEAGLLTIDVPGGDSIDVTLSGYIPAAPFSGSVPAVGVWGVVVMALMLAGAGTFVFRRARAA